MRAVGTKIMDEILERVSKKISEQNMIPSGGHVVCGVSGGPDSLCMVHLLNEIKSELDFSLSIVHLNHMFRGQESDSDQWFVENYSEEMGIPILSRKIDVTERAKNHGLTNEEAGRECRYELYDEAAVHAVKTYGLPKEKICIAVAHNRNDQAETIIMRIIRGTGPDGLAGMESNRVSVAGFRIIRPLLETDSVDIAEYNVRNSLFPKKDSSNAERIAMRNKMRLDMIPYINEHYNECFIDALIRLGNIAADDKAYFDDIIEKILSENNYAQVDGDDQRASLPLLLLAGSPPPIRHRLITRVYERIGLLQDIEEAHIRMADKLIMDGMTGKSVDFPKGYRFEIEYDDVIFLAPGDTDNDLVGVFAIAIADIANIKENGVLFEGSRLPLFAELKEDITSAQSSTEDQLLLDYDLLVTGNSLLTLRSRNPGDRISPVGMDGSAKIQDIFVDKKIPRRDRGRIPLITTENEVLWIPGIRRTRLYPVTEKTKRILRLKPL